MLTFEDWYKRVREIMRDGEVAAIAEICPKCYGTLPSEEGGNGYGGRAKPCECGENTTDARKILKAHGLDAAERWGWGEGYADEVGRR